MTRTVALISFVPSIAENCVDLAGALAGHVGIHWLLPRSDAAELSRDVDPAVRLEPFSKPRLRQPVRQARMSRQLVRRLRAIDPDVVHLQQGHLWFNLALGRLRDRPLVLTVHEAVPHPGDRPSRKTPQPLSDLALRRADRVIVHSRAVGHTLADRGFPADRIHVVPLVAPPLGSLPEPARERTGHNVLFFGRMWPYKGMRHLIAAEPLIAAQFPDVRIVLAGSGEDLGDHRRAMVHPERFTVHEERVSREQRDALFAVADVVVLPYEQATQSGVALVAFAHGVPVVASRVGGLPEMVQDGRTGLLVPPRDPAALAAAVCRLLGDAELRRRFGEEGRRRVRDEWSAAAAARETLEVYELACGVTLRRRRHPPPRAPARA